jgi:hypothetical protein
MDKAASLDTHDVKHMNGIKIDDTSALIETLKTYEVRLVRKKPQPSDSKTD